MELLKLINENKNWIEILQNKPYCLKIKTDGEFYILNYKMIESDFGLEIVQQSRGCIVAKDESGWHYVCRPFDKFFNYGESYAASIDWESAIVEEKIDGSIMKLWFYKDQWHLSTNGTINAFMAPVGDSNLSFGDIFNRALGMDFEDYAKKANLNPLETYIFELTSPESKVVISYEDNIYFLGARNNYYGYYKYYRNLPGNIKYPKEFTLDSLDSVIRVSLAMSKEEEGMVVRDSEGRRIKVKSPAYLEVSHLFKNGALTTKTILKMIKDASLDDYLAYFPEDKGKVCEVLNSIVKYKETLEKEYSYFSTVLNNLKLTDRFKIYQVASAFNNTSFLMKKYYNQDLSVTDYIDNMPVKKLCEVLN